MRIIKLIFLIQLAFMPLINAVEIGSTAVYSVADITFTGPSQTQNDASLDFWVTFTHESGSPSYKIWGFFDGNGSGGNSGNIFKVRFCPTKAGNWNITDTYSTDGTLNNQKEGDYVTATASSNHGFWQVETSTGGGRWYKRSDGSHPFVIGNTHYDMLNFRDQTGIVSDVNGNATYYKKIRFMIDGSEGYHGAPPAGTYPNVGFYNSKADLAINTALPKDLIADIILYKSLYISYGEAYVKYIAARYGSYPNVWFCLANEWDIKGALTSDQAKTMGQQLRKYIPYGNPLSIHPNSQTGWNTALNTTPAWNDHKIAQLKTKILYSAADNTILNYKRTPVGMPSINDENGYEGSGDGYTGDDVIEGITGSFSGGGFGSTAYKPAKGEGQYYKGNFNATEHSASDNLKWMRETIDAHIEFWKLEPIAISSSIFSGGSTNFRALQETGKQYVLCSNSAKTFNITLPAGTWTLKQINSISKTITTTTDLSGEYSLTTPSSRSCINYFVQASVSPSPEIFSPSVSTTFSPGKSYTAIGSGLNLSWKISVVGGSEIKTGTGSSITFTVPLTIANNAQIKIELTGGTNSNEVVSQLNTVLDDAPVIADVTENAVVNIPFTLQLTATGAGAPFTWTSINLPSGITLSTSGLIEGSFSSIGTKSITVTATDIDGDAVSKTITINVTDAPPAFCETGGQVVIEAENYTSKNPNGDLVEWSKESAYAGYAGTGYMQTPTAIISNGIWIEAADISYNIKFSTTGTYTIWCYRYSPDGTSNSSYIGIDGVQLGTTFDNGGTGSWGWVKHTTTFTVSEVGIKTLNIRRREQGMCFDKFILTTDDAFTPIGNAQYENEKCTSTVTNSKIYSRSFIYPNPAESSIIIDVFAEYDQVIVKNILGQKLISTKRSSITSVDLSMLSPAIYIVELLNENELIYSQKIIKK